MSKVLSWDEVARRGGCGEEVARTLQDSLIEKGWGVARGPTKKMLDVRRALLDAGHPTNEVALCAVGDYALVVVGEGLESYCIKDGETCLAPNPFFAGPKYADVGVLIPLQNKTVWLHSGPDV